MIEPCLHITDDSLWKLIRTVTRSSGEEISLYYCRECSARKELRAGTETRENVDALDDPGES